MDELPCEVVTGVDAELPEVPDAEEERRLVEDELEEEEEEDVVAADVERVPDWEERRDT